MKTENHENRVFCGAIVN